MKIGICSDHAGFEYKTKIISYLLGKGYEVVNFGTDSTESMDYPDVAHPLADAVEKGGSEMNTKRIAALIIAVVLVFFSIGINTIITIFKTDFFSSFDSMLDSKTLTYEKVIESGGLKAFAMQELLLILCIICLQYSEH